MYDETEQYPAIVRRFEQLHDHLTALSHQSTSKAALVTLAVSFTTSLLELLRMADGTKPDIGAALTELDDLKQKVADDELADDAAVDAANQLISTLAGENSTLKQQLDAAGVDMTPVLDKIAEIKAIIKPPKAVVDPTAPVTENPPTDTPPAEGGETPVPTGSPA